MGLNVGELVTVRADARKPYVLQMQFHAEITRHTDRGYYIKTDGAFEVDAKGTLMHDATGRLVPAEFGPFHRDQLLDGWRDLEGNWRT